MLRVWTVATHLAFVAQSAELSPSHCISAFAENLFFSEIYLTLSLNVLLSTDAENL